LTRGAETKSDPFTALTLDIGQATAQLTTEHRDETSTLQHSVDRVTAVAAWPGFAALLALVIGLWIGGNALAPMLGAKPIDPPPFPWLQGALTAGALFVAILILTTQRREDQLAARRSQLILEIVLLNDQKISKAIELMEEVRRDNPAILNRVDVEAAAMSTPADAQTVLAAIRDVQDVQA